MKKSQTIPVIHAAIPQSHQRTSKPVYIAYKIQHVGVCALYIYARNQLANQNSRNCTLLTFAERQLRFLDVFDYFLIFNKQQQRRQTAFAHTHK